MLVSLYFLVVVCSLGLLLGYCLSNKSPPLAGIFLLLALGHGLLFKPFLLLISGYESVVGSYILSGVSPVRFWLGGVYVASAFSIVILVIVCLDCAYNSKKNSIGFEYYFSACRIYFDTVICSSAVLVSLLALGFFLANNPDLLSFRGKNSLATTHLESYSASGLTRLVINFANIVVFLMIHNVVSGFKVRRSRTLGFLAAAIYLFYAVVSDQRALILFSMLSWSLFLVSCGVRLSRMAWMASIFTSMLLVIFGTIRRLSVSSADFFQNFLAILANFAGKNFIDITKTISIFDAQPPLRFGSTFLDTLLILIPRSLFPEKTTVNIDTLVASEVFEVRSFGSGAVPPGVIGEMLFNFGPIGIPLGIVLCGLIVWLIDMGRYTGRSFYLMFYFMSLYMVGVGILGSSFQSTFLGFLMAGLPLFFLHKLSMKRLCFVRHAAIS